MNIKTLLFLSILFLTTKVVAQVDSTYIGFFEHDFSARVYIASKVAGFDIAAPSDEQSGFNYRINAPVGIGVGASWKDYSFAFSRRFGFLRNDDKGKTNSLEFLYHGFKRKFVYSISLQHHSGFYDERTNSNGLFTKYPDTKINMYGGSFQWIFNNKKFSYRAAFNQSERQLKSAGSSQLGVAINYTKLRADSVMLLPGMQKAHENLQFGLNGGYVYSWVLSRGWFLTGSVDVGVNIGNNYPKRVFKEKLELYPTLNSRIAAGYNMRSWSLGFSSYYGRTYLFMDGKNNMSMNEFNMQLHIIKRFSWGNKFVNNTLDKTKQKMERFGF